MPSKKIHRQSAFFKMPTRVPLLIFLRFSHKNNVKECYNCAKVQNSLSCSLKNKIFGSAKRRNLQHIFTQTKKRGCAKRGNVYIYIYIYITTGYTQNNLYHSWVQHPVIIPLCTKRCTQRYFLVIIYCPQQNFWMIL